MRPRATLGAALVLGGYLLISPLPFFLLPLGLLLILSRPDRPIAWAIVGGAAVICIRWFWVSDPLPMQAAKAWGVAATGTYLALSVPERRRSIDAAIVAALLAGVAVTLWLGTAGSGLDEVVRLVLRELWPAASMIEASTPELSGEGIVVAFATIFPALMMLQGIAGLSLARRWSQMVTGRLPEAATNSFSQFRFGDHTVWVLIAGVAGKVAQLAGYLDPAVVWPATLIIFAGGLYVVRGLAVVRGTVLPAGPAPWPLLLLWGLVILFLWPFVATGMFGVGLADTWLDFRRRAADARGE